MMGSSQPDTLAISAFEHPWLSGLFGDAETARCLCAETSLKNMLRFEAAYSKALGACGAVDKTIAERTATAILSARPNPEALRTGTRQDGVLIPALLRQLKAAMPEELHIALHQGLTSQDVIDTALVMSLRDVGSLFANRLRGLDNALSDLETRFATAPLMARTRMQAALEITVGDRLRSWRDPLAKHAKQLPRKMEDLCVLQLGGAVGDRQALGPQADEIAAHMAQNLDLANPSTSWHTQRECLADFANWLSLVTGALGKMGQDIALMAQQGIDEITLSGGGGSSAMPHKQNPVLAELLITLARFNATQLSAMHLSLIHEQERSGAAWALEWVVLPQMIMATGRALVAAQDLTGCIVHMGRRP